MLFPSHFLVISPQRAFGGSGVSKSVWGEGREGGTSVFFFFSPGLHAVQLSLGWWGPRAGGGHSRPRCRRTPGGAAGRGASFPAFYGPRCPTAAHLRSPLPRGKEGQSPGVSLQKQVWRRGVHSGVPTGLFHAAFPRRGKPCRKNLTFPEALASELPKPKTSSGCHLKRRG